MTTFADHYVEVIEQDRLTLHQTMVFSGMVSMQTIHEWDGNAKNGKQIIFNDIPYTPLQIDELTYPPMFRMIVRKHESPRQPSKEQLFRSLYNDAHNLIIALQLGTDPTDTMRRLDDSLRIVERELGWKRKGMSEEDGISWNKPVQFPSVPFEKLFPVGSSFTLFYGAGNPNNRTVHVRAYVDDGMVVYRVWSKVKRRWIYDVDRCSFFDMQKQYIKELKGLRDE